MKGKRFFVSSLLLFVILVPPIVSLAVHREIQHRMRLKIRGHFIPVPFSASYFVKGAGWEWKEKVKLSSGTIRVAYHPFSFLFGKTLHVRLTGTDLHAEFLGDWAKIQGVRQTVIRRLDTDFAIGQKGLEAIHALKVDSPAFQFHLKESELLTGASSSPSRPIGAIK